MYRVITVLSASLLLSACASSGTLFSSDPVTDTIRFESEPAGADVTVAGQSCKTPCALPVAAAPGVTATFSLRGFATETEQLELVSMGDGTSRLRPNPVLVELSPAPPTPARKPAPRRKPAAKPRAASAPAAGSDANASAPAPAAPPAAAAPWPGTPAR